MIADGFLVGDNCVATLKAFDGQFLGERIVFMVPCDAAGCQYVSASSRGITMANGGAAMKVVMAGAYPNAAQRGLQEG